MIFGKFYRFYFYYFLLYFGCLKCIILAFLDLKSIKVQKQSIISYSKDLIFNFDNNGKIRSSMFLRKYATCQVKRIREHTENRPNEHEKFPKNSRRYFY